MATALIVTVTLLRFRNATIPTVTMTVASILKPIFVPADLVSPQSYGTRGQGEVEPELSGEMRRHN
jgi:hypothetical protein